LDFQGTRFEIEIDKLRFDCEAMAHIPFCKNTAVAGLEAFYEAINFGVFSVSIHLLWMDIL